MITKVLTVLGSLVALAIVGGLIALATYSIQYDRQRERSCLAVGGTVVHNPAPGQGTGGSGAGLICMKVDVTLSPIPVVVK